MPPIGFILVPGTWSWNPKKKTGEWYQPGSPFINHLESCWFEVWSKELPFIWNTRINGLPFGPHRHRDWESAGFALRVYVDPLIPDIGISVPAERRNVIAHSHGLQVALFAAAQGCHIHTLISVGSPVRKDMMDVAKAARPHIEHWIHIASDGSDRMQWFGELFDGALGIVRSHPLANYNYRIPKVGHSGLIRDPKHFPLWEQTGIFSVVRDWHLHDRG